MRAANKPSLQDEGHADVPSQTAVPNSWLTRLFGCRHRNMSPPFTGGEETYRSCMNCGARRLFNVERGRMTGSYYYAPLSGLYETRVAETTPKGER